MSATLLVALLYEVEVQRHDVAKRRISTSTDNGLALTGLASFILERALIKIILYIQHSTCYVVIIAEGFSRVESKTDSSG